MDHATTKAHLFFYSGFLYFIDLFVRENLPQAASFDNWGGKSYQSLVRVSDNSVHTGSVAGRGQTYPDRPLFFGLI